MIIIAAGSYREGLLDPTSLLLNFRCEKRKVQAQGSVGDKPCYAQESRDKSHSPFQWGTEC